MRWGPDFEALHFEFNGVPVQNLNSKAKDQFQYLLGKVLQFLGAGRLLRHKPKPFYTEVLRIRGHDEPSYQISRFGQLIHDRAPLLRCVYIFLVLLVTHALRFVKEYRWIFGTASAFAVVLRVLEIVESAVATLVIAVLLIGASTAGKAIARAFDYSYPLVDGEM